jgi:uncharacterized protein (TIGR00251 family)
MIAITEHPEGCILPVRAHPGARKNAVIGEHNRALKVAVTAPADRGKANKALVELLSESLDLKRAQIELWSGLTSHDKRFLVRGMKAAELQACIAEFMR